MPSPFSIKRIRISTKTYRCDFCSRIIKKKDAYLYLVGRKDGKFWSIKYCKKCGHEEIAKLMMAKR